jgi:hypothetical protein
MLSPNDSAYAVIFARVLTPSTPLTFPGGGRAGMAAVQAGAAPLSVLIRCRHE